MKYMRFLSVASVFAVLMLGLAAPLMAAGSVSAVDVVQSCNDPAAAQTNVCQETAAQGASGANPAIGVIKMVIGVVSYIGGAAAVIGLIIYGLRILLANGDSNTISASRTGILYSLIGIIVIVFAQLIVVFILNKVN
jgi:hypothetical protein